jgi:hypothetical protein
MPLSVPVVAQGTPSAPLSQLDRIRRLPFPTTPALDAALVSLGINTRSSLKEKATTSASTIMSMGAAAADKDGGDATTAITATSVPTSPHQHNQKLIQKTTFDYLGSGKGIPSPSTAGGDLSTTLTISPAKDRKQTSRSLSPLRKLSPTSTIAPNENTQSRPTMSCHEHQPLSLPDDLDTIAMLATTTTPHNRMSSVDKEAIEDGVCVSSYMVGEQHATSNLKDRHRYEQMDAAGELPRLEPISHTVRVFIPRPTSGNVPPDTTVSTFEAFHIATIIDNPFNPGALQADLSVSVSHPHRPAETIRAPVDATLFAMCPIEGLLWVDTSRLSSLGCFHSYVGADQGVSASEGGGKGAVSLKPHRVSAALLSKSHSQQSGQMTPIPLQDIPHLVEELGLSRSPSNNPSEIGVSSSSRVYRGGSLMRVSIPIFYKVLDLCRPIITTEQVPTMTSRPKNKRSGSKKGSTTVTNASLFDLDNSITTVQEMPQFDILPSSISFIPPRTPTADINGSRGSTTTATTRLVSVPPAAVVEVPPSTASVAVCKGFASTSEGRVIVELIFEEGGEIRGGDETDKNAASSPPTHTSPLRSSRFGVDHAHTFNPRSPVKIHPDHSTEPQVRGVASHQSASGPKSNGHRPAISIDDIDPRTSFLANLLPPSFTFLLDQSDARWRATTQSLSADTTNGLWYSYPLLFVRMVPWLRDVEEALTLPPPNDGDAPPPTTMEDFATLLAVSITALEEALGRCGSAGGSTEEEDLLDAAAMAAETASLMYHASKVPDTDKPWDITICATLLALRADLVQRISTPPGTEETATALHPQTITSALVDLGHVLKLAGGYQGALDAYTTAVSYAKRIPLPRVLSAQLLASLMVLQGEAAMMCGLLIQAERYLDKAASLSAVVVESMEPTTAGGLMARAARAEMIDLRVICGLQANLALDCGVGTIEDGSKLRVRQNQELLAQLASEGSETHARTATIALRRGISGGRSEERADPRFAELTALQSQGTLSKALALLLAGCSVGEHASQHRNQFHAQLIATCATLLPSDDVDDKDADGVSTPPSSMSPIIAAQALVIQGLAFDQQVRYYTTRRGLTTRGETRSGIATRDDGPPGTAGGWSLGGTMPTSFLQDGVANSVMFGDDSEEEDVDMGWVRGEDGYAVVPPLTGSFGEALTPLDQPHESPPRRRISTANSTRNIYTSDSHHRPQTSKTDFYELMRKKCFTEAGEVVVEAASILNDTYSPQLLTLTTLPIQYLELYHAAGTSSLLEGGVDMDNNASSSVVGQWWSLHRDCDTINAPTNPVVVSVALMAASCEVLSGATPSAYQTVPLLVASGKTPSTTTPSSTVHLKRKTGAPHEAHLPQGVPLRLVPEDTLRKADSIHRTRVMLAQCCGRAFLHHLVPSITTTPQGDSGSVPTAIHPLTSLLMEWAAAELLQLGDVQGAAPLLATIAEGLDKRLGAQAPAMDADHVPLCVSVFPSGTPASALSPTKGGGEVDVSIVDRHERRKHRDKLKLRNVVSLSSVRRLSYIGTVCGGGLIELLNSHEASVRLCLSTSSFSSSNVVTQHQSLQSLCTFLPLLMSLSKDGHTSRLQRGTAASAATDWPDWESTFAALITQQLLAAQLQPLVGNRNSLTTG